MKELFFSLFQIKQLWGDQMTVNGHHTTWEHKNIPWLWPENQPLQKPFRGEIHSEHLHHLRTTDWTREKVRKDCNEIFNGFLTSHDSFRCLSIWEKSISDSKELALECKLSTNGTTLLQWMELLYWTAIKSLSARNFSKTPPTAFTKSCVKFKASSWTWPLTREPTWTSRPSSWTSSSNSITGLSTVNTKTWWTTRTSC